MLPTAIIIKQQDMLASAVQCSKQLNIPITETTEDTCYLEFNHSKISIIQRRDKQTLCFTHDFTANNVNRRLQSQNQHLLKAFKDKQKAITSVCDLTAGWCRDSFILAKNGYHITAVEQSPIIHFITQFSLQNLAKDDTTTLKLIHANSFDYLSTVDKKPQAIYLDPMFPTQQHQAKNKKEIQLLQNITQNTQIDDLFQLALKQAQQRVVIKRPLHSEFLSQTKPSFQYTGKTIRFDVYQCA